MQRDEPISRRAPARTRIKFCGLTRLADVDAAVALGVDAIGLVFYPPSPRAVTVEQAIELVSRIPPLVQVVGLFVDADPAAIQHVTSQVPLDILQLHGQETPEQCGAIAQLTNKRWYKALTVPGDLAPDVLQKRIADYRRAGAAGLLLDAWHPELAGGSGQQFDWQQFPPVNQRDAAMLLAGGLTPENVGEAIRLIRPDAVDVSSGIEEPDPIEPDKTLKGCKSLLRMQSFVEAVRLADRQYEQSV